MTEFASNIGLRIALGVIFFALLGFCFYRLGRGQGKLAFAIFCAALLALFVISPASPVYGFIPLIVALAWIEWRRSRRAAGYQAAVARIEGGGIKRGLTPAEGAVLLGRPINVTLTLVIFEMLRKAFLRQTGGSPLRVEVAEAFRTRGSSLSAQERGDHRRQAAQKINASLHKYEEPFLELIEANPGLAIREIDFGVAVQPLVRYVAGRVGGYSLEESRTYYKLIIERAPKEARSDGKLTFDRERIFNRNFGWVLLGPDFVNVLDQKDYSYIPLWMKKEPVDLGKLTFAQWAQTIFAELDGVIDEKDVKLNLGDDSDVITATLLNDIGRATFYG